MLAAAQYIHVAASGCICRGPCCQKPCSADDASIRFIGPRSQTGRQALAEHCFRKGDGSTSLSLLRMISARSTRHGIETAFERFKVFSSPSPTTPSSCKHRHHPDPTTIRHQLFRNKSDCSDILGVRGRCWRSVGVGRRGARLG